MKPMSKYLLVLSICFNFTFLFINQISVVLKNTTLSSMEVFQRHELASTGSNAAAPTSKATAIKRVDASHSKKVCRRRGIGLVGPLTVNVEQLSKEAMSLDLLSATQSGEVEFGGWWEPRSCTPRTKVAILVPLRDRESQFKTFLWHMHPILQRQHISYRIFAIEQVGNTTFNKGAIYNIGFNETLSIGDFDCYIFHDVDLLTENDKNIYDCISAPRHMSVAVDTLKYRLSYLETFGGVEVLTKDQFIDVNGFSNLFWGWGAEDDDLYTRISFMGYNLARPPQTKGRYISNQKQHNKNAISKESLMMIHDEKGRKSRIKTDGLNQISNLRFTKTVKEELIFTRVSIHLKR